jgi:hypothetical protein
MIIHQGRGVLIAIITFLCLLAAEAFTRTHFHDNGYYQQHPWPKLAACLVAAALVWWLSPRKNQAAATPPEQSWLVSHSQGLPATEPEASALKVTLFRDSDSLFFIRVKYWPALLCLLGVVLYFVPDAKLP